MAIEENGGPRRRAATRRAARVRAAKASNGEAAAANDLQWVEAAGPGESTEDGLGGSGAAWTGSDGTLSLLPMLSPVGDLQPPAPAGALKVLSSTTGWISYRYSGMRRQPDLARGIESALRQLSGVRSAQVKPLTGRIRVRFDPRRVRSDQIDFTIFSAEPMAASEAVGEDGHAAPTGDLCDDPGGPCCYIGRSPLALGLGAAEQMAEETRQLNLQRRRLAIGGAALGGLLAARVLLGAAAAANPLLTLAAAAATIYSGLPLLRDGLRSLTGRSPLSPNALITAATAASLLLGEGMTALVVIWLLNLGAILQMATQFRTRRAIESLLSIGEQEVWLVKDGVEIKVPLESLQIGDTVAVYADEKIPVDGEVVHGTGSVNQALITGESMPTYKTPGEQVYAGTVLELGSLRVQATGVGSETAVGRLIDRVEQARQLRAPIETVAETFSRRFVPVSFALAALVFLVTRDIRRAMTMLVIACPCAAGLSTPTAVTASIGNAARRGVLVKGGSNLEAAGKLDTIILDKTGTLTTGKANVSQVLPLDPAYSPRELVRIAAAAEYHSKHPLAAAVLRHARELAVEVPDRYELETLAGRGVRAELDGQQILVGSDRLMREFGVPLPPDVPSQLVQLREAGETVLCIAVDDRLIGLIGVSDSVRPQAHEAIAMLHRAGLRRVLLCTGDSTESARIVAGQLGLTEYRGEFMPDDKFKLVEELKAAGHQVAMVGDGINDAPALALADVGIAMGTAGSDVAIEAADISLAGDDLRDVATVLDLSRHTLAVVKQNYGLALGVNSAGIVVGAAGALSPILAAVLHNLSTITVVANSGRLIGYQPPAARLNGQNAERKALTG